MALRFELKPFLFFTLGFILFTVIGTLSHEYGHILVAKYYGYDTKLHYGSMNYYPQGYLQDEAYQNLDTLLQQYGPLEKEGWPESVKAKFDAYNRSLHEKYNDQWKKGLLMIRWGGPMQTMLTGFFGLVLLFYCRAQIKDKGLSRWDWIAVFLALFWLRQVFNLLLGFAHELLMPNGNWFGGDEYYLAKSLDIWKGSIAVTTGTFGLLAALLVVFKYVPSKLRLTFIASGLLGGAVGYYLWMQLIGPLVLP